VPGETSGFSSHDSIIQANKKLIQDLVEKVEALDGKRPKDTTEEGTKDKEQIIIRQDKFISQLQQDVTDLSRSKGIQEQKVQPKEKDRRASIEKNAKRNATVNGGSKRVTRTTSTVKRRK